MNTLNEINEQISKYALFCKKGIGNNLIIIFNEKPLMKIAVEYDLPIAKLRTLNKMFGDNQLLSPNMRFGIITSSKITGEIIRNADKIEFFRQTTKNTFPKTICETIISEFKEMKNISDINCSKNNDFMPILG